MDGSHFDTLVKTLATMPLSRANVLRGLAASAAVLTGGGSPPNQVRPRRSTRKSRRSVSVGRMGRSPGAGVKDTVKTLLRRNPCTYGEKVPDGDDAVVLDRHEKGSSHRHGQRARAWWRRAAGSRAPVNGTGSSWLTSWVTAETIPGAMALPPAGVGAIDACPITPTSARMKPHTVAAIESNRMRGLVMESSWAPYLIGIEPIAMCPLGTGFPNPQRLPGHAPSMRRGGRLHTREITWLDHLVLCRGRTGRFNLMTDNLPYSARLTIRFYAL